MNEIHNRLQTCAQFNDKPEMIAGLVPLVEFDRILVTHLESESHQISNLRPQDLVNTVDSDEVDGTLASAFVNGTVLRFANIIVEYKVIHFSFRI